MKAGDFLLGAAVGFLVYHIYRKSSEKAAGRPMSLQEKVKLTSDVIEQESQKYSDVLKKEYDIIMPSDQISKKAEELGQQFTEGRYAINLNKVKEPFFI